MAMKMLLAIMASLVEIVTDVIYIYVGSLSPLSERTRKIHQCWPSFPS